MALRTKLCRALDCPRRVERNDIFCQVHWPMLTPKYQHPIPNNHEPGSAARPENVRSVLSGVQDAVAFIAYKEGKRGRLKQAERAALRAPGQGGVTGTGSTAGSTTSGTGAGRESWRWSSNSTL